MAGCIDAHAKAEFAAQSFEAFNACLGLIAEAEVFSFVQLGDVQSLLEDFGCEAAGGHAREFGREGNDEDRVETCFGEQMQFLGKRRDERLSRFRANNSRRVRIEGDGYRADAEKACLRYYFGDNPLMSAVNAVEVADSGNGWAEV